MAAMPPSCTHRDLAKAVGVTVTTIKSYRRKFPAFLPVESQGKPLRLAGESLTVCKRIHHHFLRGLSVGETSKRLTEEFPALAAAAHASEPEQEANAAGSRPSAPASDKAFRSAEPLARIEALMGDLFSLQNRTHSLMAELVSKLDTLTGQLAVTLPAAYKAGTEATARGRSSSPGSLRPAGAATSGGRVTPVLSPSSTASASGRAQSSVETTPDANSTLNAGAQKPEADLLGLPVVVQSEKGEFLGVTGKSGRPFALGQFEEYLLRRAEGMGSFTAVWRREDPDWVLALVGQGQVHAHHFRKATTPKGNTVALFVSLTVGGKTVSEAFLQTFLRQVKESLDD